MAKISQSRNYTLNKNINRRIRKDKEMKKKLKTSLEPEPEEVAKLSMKERRVTCTAKRGQGTMSPVDYRGRATPSAEQEAGLTLSVMK